MFFNRFKKPAVTACPNTAQQPVPPVEESEWQVQQEWVIPHLSAKKKAWKEHLGDIKGESWYVELRPSSEHTFPGIFLCRSTGEMSLCATFALTIVDPRNPGNSVLREFDNIFAKDGEKSVWYWGWNAPVVTKPSPGGLIVDDTLVVHARLRASKVNMQLLSDEKSPVPDIMLKMEDGTLLASRSLLAESSDYFKAIFQKDKSESINDVVELQKVAAADMKVILQSINGELDAIPQDRLHSLALATHRLQVNQLKERCVMRLGFCLTQDNFAQTAVLAGKVKHQGLQQACVKFAMLEENRSVLQNGELKRIMDDAPDLALKLMEELLNQSAPKVPQNG